MATGEVSIDYQTGLTLYGQIRERLSGGLLWRSATSGFETYSALSGNLSTYQLALTEQGASAHYVGSAPAPLPAGSYDVSVRNRLNAWYTDTDPFVGGGQVEWNGTTQVPLVNLATSGQIGQGFPLRLARGVMVQNFPVYMKQASDHVTALTSGVISGQISRDGGAFGVLQSGAFTEVGNGFYNLAALTSGDLLANSVSLLFNGVGISGGAADNLPMSFVLQRVSGQ